MGKKQQGNQKEFTTSAPSLPQKELYQRVNFAIQASAFLQSLAGPSISVDRKGKRKASHLDDVSHMTGHHPMESLAMATMKNTRKMVAHTQLKLDPSLKRNICRGCGTVLIPGATSRIRNRPNPSTVYVTHTTCLGCSRTLHLPTPPIEMGDSRLDGPNRRKRREKVVKRSKAAFHDRERRDGQSGHSVWVDDRRVQGWGERSTTETSFAHPDRIVEDGS